MPDVTASHPRIGRFVYELRSWYGCVGPYLGPQRDLRHDALEPIPAGALAAEQRVQDTGDGEGDDHDEVERAGQDDPYRCSKHRDGHEDARVGEPLRLVIPLIWCIPVVGGHACSSGSSRVRGRGAM